MSLYNNVAQSLASKGLMASLNSGVSSAIGQATSAAANALGGGALAKVATSALGNAANAAAKSAISKAIPPQLRAKLDAGSAVFGNIMAGDYAGAAMSALSGGLLDGLLGGTSGAAKQYAFRNTRTPAFAGLTAAQAERIADEVINARHARRNWFVVEVTSNLDGDHSDTFNLFTVDVDYDPFNLAGDKTRIGGAVMDTVNGHEPVEMRFTTYDDDSGTLKRFWATHHAAASAQDGTVGLPAQYGLRIKIVHGVVAGAETSFAYQDLGWFRTGTLSSNLSRRDPGLQELQMTFSQLDTFMRA